MANGKWETLSGNLMFARLRPGWLWLRWRDGAWCVEIKPDMVDFGKRLSATNARDAQIEALKFVRSWATELVAQAAELRGTMEGSGDV